MHLGFRKLKRFITRLVYKPVVILTFHQVSKVLDESTEQIYNWNSLDDFKQAIEQYITGGYTFVSLTEAHNIIKSRKPRNKRYVVITFDDAHRSINNVRDYLLQHDIPMTIFVNTDTIDSNSPQAQSVYLTREELFTLYNSPFHSIALHGHHHAIASELTKEEFTVNIQQCGRLLEGHPRLIPFFAYPCNDGGKEYDAIVHALGYTPCYCDFHHNTTDADILHRHGVGGMTLMDTPAIW